MQIQIKQNRKHFGFIYAFFLFVIGKSEGHFLFDAHEPELLQLHDFSPRYVLIKFLMAKTTAPATIIATIISSIERTPFF